MERWPAGISNTNRIFANLITMTASLLLKILFLSQIQPYASEANCPDTRLDGPGMPLAKTSVMDQDGMDICWAESASIVLDAWRFSHDPPKGDRNYDHLTHPLALAVLNS